MSRARPIGRAPRPAALGSRDVEQDGQDQPAGRGCRARVPYLSTAQLGCGPGASRSTTRRVRRRTRRSSKSSIRAQCDNARANLWAPSKNSDFFVGHDLSGPCASKGARSSLRQATIKSNPPPDSSGHRQDRRSVSDCNKRQVGQMWRSKSSVILGNAWMNGMSVLSPTGGFQRQRTAWLI